MPPWKEKSTTKTATKSETKGARQEGGRRVPGSGNGRQKGDYRTAQFRTEDKTTEKASYRLQLSTLKKIEHEAVTTPPCLMPKMRLTIQGETFWVMREKDCISLGIGIGALGE